MERLLQSISVRSRRQAMEWSLVLTSQSIDSIVDRTEQGWVVQVEPARYAQALAVLAQYRKENKGWGWKHPAHDDGPGFHWGSLGWVAAIGAFYYWSEVRYPGALDLGVENSEKITAGQWWRLLTAVTLHENLSHLMANAAMGFLLMGFAMARYGAGVGLLAAFAAGVAGNAAGWLIYSLPHQSLGASGMVTGALGLVTVQTFSFWRKYAVGARFFYRAVAAGVLILALVGFSPDSDVVAHVAGFITGAILGCVLSCAPRGRRHHGFVNAAAVLALAALLLTAWHWALSAP